MIFSIYASQPLPEQMCSIYKQRALTPTKNRHPSLHFAVCLCFCSNSSCSNKGSALSLMPAMGLRRRTLWPGTTSASLCLSAELLSIFHVRDISRSREDSAPHEVAPISSWAVATEATAGSSSRSPFAAQCCWAQRNTNLLP